MPTVKASAASTKNSKIPVQEADPKEVEKLGKSIISKDQAPTVGEQTTSKTDWTRFSTQLGPPFDSERITLAQCRQIRKDPMVAFGLHYRKVPLVTSEWHINARDKKGPNPQVAAFVDACLRPIFAPLVFQRTLAYDFGYQAIVKRFQLSNPGGVFTDPTVEANPDNPEAAIKPIWDQGTILPKNWRRPVALKPELVEPMFDQKTGEFSGIAYTPPAGSRGAATGFKSGRSGSNQATNEIDVYHAYWATFSKDNEHGNIYGYPLVAYARDYWWNYRFLFFQAARAYERLAIPPILAYHPEGSTAISDTESRPNYEIALEAAERLRSNAVAAVPSTMAAMGIDASSGSQREWDFKFMETPTEALTVFDARFNYLNVMKLRSIMIPETALIEGSGGTSSRNVATQMGDMFEKAEKLEMDDIADDINRFWIPDLLTVNFPDFINNGGSAQFISHGFKSEDIEFQKQVIQLLGQNKPEFLDQVDLTKLLDSLGLPMKDPAQFAREQAELQQQATQIPTVTPGPGSVGVVPTPQTLGGATNGGSSPSAVAGFSDDGYPLLANGWEQRTMYIQPNEYMTLTDVEDFISSLPNSKHYQDKTVRAQMMKLRGLWKKHYQTTYADFATFVAGNIDLELADDKRPVKVAIKKAKQIANKLVKAWTTDSEAYDKLISSSKDIMRKIIKRSATLELKNSKLKATVDPDDIDAHVEKQIARLSSLTDKTIRDELSGFLTNEIRAGKSPQELASGVLEHYQGMTTQKANNVARSETRDLVNIGTLISGEAAGIDYVVGTDGEEFDPECAARNGKLFPIKEALTEVHKEHTNGTLGFKHVPNVDFSIRYVNEMPDDVEDGVTGYFDDETCTAIVKFGDPMAEDFLSAVGRALSV